jgi:hypothetical protein
MHAISGWCAQASALAPIALHEATFTPQKTEGWRPKQGHEPKAVHPQCGKVQPRRSLGSIGSTKGCLHSATPTTRS